MFKFDIDTIVTPAVKSAKTFSSMIAVDSIRKAVDTVIDANAELTTSVFGSFQAYADAVQPAAAK